MRTVVKKGFQQGDDSLYGFLQDDQVALEVILQTREHAIRADLERVEKRVEGFEERVAALERSAKTQEEELRGELQALGARLARLEASIWWKVG